MLSRKNRLLSASCSFLGLGEKPNDERLWLCVESEERRPRGSRRPRDVSRLFVENPNWKSWKRCLATSSGSRLWSGGRNAWSHLARRMTCSSRENCCFRTLSGKDKKNVASAFENSWSVRKLSVVFARCLEFGRRSGALEAAREEEPEEGSLVRSSTACCCICSRSRDEKYFLLQHQWLAF